MNKFKIEIKWAVIFALMTLAWLLLERLTGLHSTHIDKHAIYTNFIAIPAIAIYVFALLDKRKTDYQGVMSYKQGFITGLIITLIVTALGPLVQYITFTVITPDYFENVTDFVVREGKMTLAEAQDYFSIKSYILQGFVVTPVMGILTTAVVAFFTRKKESEDSSS